ncbi:hypothetical protein HXX76_008587 [Chlamydomonas incerta]|uniref:Uncharacterized protein n=1 Tax=Chlamydomonas incerta TaxID=51695 RepID=A0A835W0T4_CHLIN|nr:hypothetical protein HXX76_008587 [Chlamydomonas incerta]|eukprot:KAG2432854.1 hypothetical protein HXX76_008587 [Chlamydomonas incerta]
MLDVAGSPAVAAGGEWTADRVPAASAAVWRSPDALPRLAQEPPPEGAPYTELLLSLQRIGCDLCRMAAAGSEASGGLGDDVGEWLEEWQALLRQALEQLKRLLVDRAAVSSYPAQGAPGDAGVQDRSSRSQLLTNHAQLRAAVELLLLQVAELPSPAGGGVAGAAMDAVDYLVCKSSFADFDRCDAAARDILIGGCVKLSQLAAERLRGCGGGGGGGAGSPGAGGGGGGSGASDSWQEVLGLSLQRLVGWLQQQSHLVASMSEVADLRLEARRLRVLGPYQLGGLHWSDAAATNPTSGGYRDLLFTRLAAEHRNVLSKLCKQLTVLVRAVGRPLAELLLQPASVQGLLQPDRTRDACRNDKLLLLSTTVQVLALQQQPRQHGGGDAVVATVQPGAADPQAAGAVGHSGARAAYELVVASQLQVAVERLLHLDYVAPADMSVHAITPQPPCRDYAVPLLGFLHALTQHANNQPGTSHVQRATLGSWDRIEAAAAAAVGFMGGGSGAFLRRVWESRVEPHQRMLAVALLANAARGLVALRRTDLVASALLPVRASPAKEQMGLLGVWLRLAMESGSDRAMLQMLTAGLLRAPEAQALFCWPAASCDSTSPETAAADICARSEAVAEQVLTALGALAQQQRQLPALESQQRSGQLLALLDGLDVSAQHLNEELRRGDAAASPAAVDGAGKDPMPLSAATLQAHRHMASVALAAQAACAGGALDLHAALGGVLLGAGAGRLDAARWERAQGAVRLLEVAAAMAVEDVASLTFHASCDTAGVQRWHEALRRRSSGGLLAELWGVLTHVFDSRMDLAPMQGKSSVETRCLVLLCSIVMELPGAEDTPEHVKAEKLRLLAAKAAAQQLAPPDAACAAVTSAAAARDSAARALHRCVTGAMRHYCKAGLGAHLKTALVRHAMHALAWLRELLKQPELRQADVAERLMPALLCLVVEALCEVRGQLLAQQLLLVDGEAGPGASQPTQPQSGGDVLSRRRLSLRLVGAVLEAAADVMKLAADCGLLASQEQAAKTEKGSVHIESSPLQCMEAAARRPLSAAAGCALGLLLRVCVECSVVWLRPDRGSVQSAALTAGLPPAAEHRKEVLSRLSSCAGFPAPAEEWQAVRNELRASSSPHASKLAGRPPHQEGGDEAARLSATALGCLARLTEECGPEGRHYMLTPAVCIRTLLQQCVSGAVQLDKSQKNNIARFLRAQQSPQPAGLQQGPPQPVARQAQQQQQQQQRSGQLLQSQLLASQHQPDPSTLPNVLPSAPHGPQQQQSRRPENAPQASQAGHSRVQAVAPARGAQAQQYPGQQQQQQQQRAAPRPAASAAVTVSSSQPSAAGVDQGHLQKRKRQAPGLHEYGARDMGAGAAAAAAGGGVGGGGGAVSGAAGGGRSSGSSAGDREASTVPFVYATGRTMEVGGEEYRAMLESAVAFADLPAWYDNRRHEQQEQQGSGAPDVPPLLARVSMCNTVNKLGNGQLFNTVVTLVDGSVSGPPKVLLYLTGEEGVIRDMHAALSRQPVVAVYGAVQFKGTTLQGNEPFKIRLHIDTRGDRSDLTRCGVVIRPRQTQQGPLATAPTAATAGAATAPATLPRGGQTPKQAAGPGPQAGTTPAVEQARGAPGSGPEVPPPQRHVTPWRGVFAAASDDEDDPLLGGGGRGLPGAGHDNATAEEGADYIPATQDTA